MSAKRRPPVVGRVLGAIFAASWLARLGLEVARRRRSGFDADAALILAGLALTPLAPVLAHRHRFFGNLPHHRWQLALVAGAAAGNFAALGFLLTGKRLGRLDPDMVFAGTTAAMLQSPFVSLVLGMPRSVFHRWAADRL